MGAFKRFLDENYDPFDGAQFLAEAGDWQEDKYGHVHSFNVGPHHVQVSYNRDTPEPHATWNVNYDVNGWFDKSYPKMIKRPTNTPPDPEITSEHEQKILHGVAGSIHHFIRNQKPARIAMAGNSPQKMGLYREFARHLAKHHGGKYFLGGPRGNVPHVEFSNE